MDYAITNPRWARPGMIDVDWNHPTLGSITYSCIDGSGEDEMQAIWDAIHRGEFGEIADAEDPVATDPAERSGMVVSRFQAKAAMLQAGILEQVEEAIRNSDAITQLAWAEAVEFRRTSPAIAAIGAALDLTDEDIDELFVTAAGIDA